MSYTNIPLELGLYTFNYLQVQDQASASRACKPWRVVAKNSRLEYGKVFAVMRMAISQPNCVELADYLAPQSYYRCFGTHKKWMLLDPRHRISYLSLVNKLSGEVVKIDLKGSLTKEEGADPVLKEQSLVYAAWLGSKIFLTVTGVGTVACWKIREKKNVTCTTHWQIFTNEELAEIAADRNEVIRHCVYHAWVTKKHLYVSGLKGRMRDNFLDAFSLISHEKIDHKDYPSIDYPKLEAGSGTKLFDIHMEHLRIFHENSSGVSLIREIPIPREERVSSCRWQMIGANEKWVVTATYYRNISWQTDRNSAHFHIFDAVSNELVWSFKEDYEHLRNRFAHDVELEKSAWLCKDFVVVWVGKMLHVWYIPTQSYLSAVNLTRILDAEMLGDTEKTEGNPIIHVELGDRELRVTFQPRKHGPSDPGSQGRYPSLVRETLKIAAFNIDHPEDPLAIECTLRDPPRRVPNNQWQQVARKMKDSVSCLLEGLWCLVFILSWPVRELCSLLWRVFAYFCA